MINHFSQNLKHYRKLRYMTQQDLADKLFVSRQAISAYEKDARRCDLDMLIRLSQVLEITLEQLIL